MYDNLEVHLCGRLVGHLLLLPSATWSFVYTEDAMANLTHGPVSLALPRCIGTHHGDVVHAVFSNLLPDGTLRQRLARSLGISESNDFALLARVGRECIGGLSLRTPGSTWFAEAAKRTLDNDELRNMVAVLPIHPLMAEADGLSKTLPGEFDKLPVRIETGQVSVVTSDAATTHIIKPAKPGLRESVLNEAYCMALAAASGLSTAPCDILHGRISVLAVERIDRDVGGNQELRHIEDFCQALGQPPSRKYEREGGPRLQDIATLLRHMSIQPAIDLRALVRWAIFTFVIGFGAAHAKQLALVHTAAGPRLAPFYGLWSTHVYPDMNFRMGFSIGAEDRPDWLTSERWREFAHSLGIRPSYVIEALRAVASSMPRRATEVAESFQRKHGHSEITRAIRAIVEQRSRQLLVAIETDPKIFRTAHVSA